MSNITRRQFVKGTVAVGTACIGFPSLIRAQGLNEKLQVGFIGADGQARSHTGYCHKAGLQCVAFAEVDKNRWNGVLSKKGWEQAAGYTDWRKVFENHRKELDVVFVAVPDHTHFAPSMTAVSMGIHCYTEKPLTWSVREAQLLAAAYAKNPTNPPLMRYYASALLKTSHLREAKDLLKKSQRDVTSRWELYQYLANRKPVPRDENEPTKQ